MYSLRLPQNIREVFESGRTFVHLGRRQHADWIKDAIGVLEKSAPREIKTVTRSSLLHDVMPVSRSQAGDLLKLIAVGSLVNGPDGSLGRSDDARDECVGELLSRFVEDAEYLTNHGHAEDGAAADFFASSFHFNSMASTLFDICLIANSEDFFLVAWRFEDA